MSQCRVFISADIEGSATGIMVCDSRAGMQNPIPTRLDERAVVIRGAMRRRHNIRATDILQHLTMDIDCVGTDTAQTVAWFRAARELGVHRVGGGRS